MIWWTLQQLKAKNPKTRCQAIEKLAREKEPQAWDALVQMLEDEEVDVRIAAVRALGTFKQERTVAALAKALQDATESVREAAVVCLKQVGSHEAFKPLVESLRDQSSNVRWHAAKGLKELGWEASDNSQRPGLDEPRSVSNYRLLRRYSVRPTFVLCKVKTGCCWIWRLSSRSVDAAAS